ncbi:hypothetical protein EV426DRAFT_703395 [Tirmania nivea]|nr:hypothetical protein EV426DRAFT_703395 [Tirmania nivea]
MLLTLRLHNLSPKPSLMLISPSRYMARTTNLGLLGGSGTVRHKCYAVARGKTPGIYSTACQAMQQTNKFPHNCMRVFADRGEAQNWVDLHNACQSELDLLDTLHGNLGSAKEKVFIPVVEWLKVKVDK